MKSFALFQGGIDQLHRDEWQTFFDAAGRETGEGFAPDPRRIIFLDIHALMARRHMARFGTTVEQIAAVAVKNRAHSALNSKAQFQQETDLKAVLGDKPIVEPLTRSMCAPLSDGAAGVVLCSERWLRQARAGDRAVRIRACAISGGSYRGIDEPSVIADAARRAYRQAGLGPDDIQLAEVHDATASCELLHYESLGFCPEGTAGAYLESGATALGGERPVNLSGGLISKGHPLGATGLGMIDELVVQLRGEAGPRQALGNPAIALQQNAGGMLGFDEALCAVTILERLS
jgi:acetyl-CoA acetyltransferase